jgi:hypothetical protein
MAIIVEITCTDRNGHRLATKTIHGVNFDATLAERKRVFEDMKTQHRESSGAEPYLFISSRPTP